ncbi:MAG: hypothetical protein ABIW33_08515 [Sphingomicrobium sp.]
MSGLRSFRSIVMVASCAGAALGCYLVSLRVASERAALEGIETRIVVQQRELRTLQTEIGTRGRLSQLERWNAGAFALSAPSAQQFVQGGFELARLAQPERKVDFQQPVVLASAPAPESQLSAGGAATDDGGAPVSGGSAVVPEGAASTPAQLLHQASLKTQMREVPARTDVAAPRPPVGNSTDRPAATAKPVTKTSVDKPGLAAVHSSVTTASTRPLPTTAGVTRKKVVDKPAATASRPVTKPVRLANSDPLAPLPVKQAARHRDSTAAR